MLTLFDFGSLQSFCCEISEFSEILLSRTLIYWGFFLGRKDLAVRSVLPPINEQKLKLCLKEKDFHTNHIDRKLQVRK